ncbi:hypothetical protein KKJ16_11300 [Xenorhabdus bovienii]|nr:hypothetical protein [Xenorhabdus bovienii]
MRLTACLITPIVKAQRYKAGVMKPLICAFENPPISVAVDLLNATEPNFHVTEKHVDLWFKEGVIGRYLLLDDMREIWFKKGLESVFDLLFSEVKSYKYLAICVNDADWATIVQSGIDLKTGEVNGKKRGKKSKNRVYITYAINNAADLYTDSEQDSTKKKLNSTSYKNKDKTYSTVQDKEYSTVEALPSPEPVIPRFELEKIYALIHGTPLPKNNTESKAEGRKESPKTINHLARIIKALVHTQYGADTAENIRRELNDPYSEISTDFSTKGIIPPNGKSLQKLLRETLIEVVPLIENVDVGKVDDN